MPIFDPRPDANWRINPRSKPPYRVENIQYGPQYSEAWRKAMPDDTWHICDASGLNVLQGDGGAVFTTKEVAEAIMERYA